MNDPAVPPPPPVLRAPVRTERSGRAERPERAAKPERPAKPARAPGRFRFARRAVGAVVGLGLVAAVLAGGFALHTYDRYVSGR